MASGIERVRFAVHPRTLLAYSRLMDPSSVIHGGTYPGQSGYVGKHRAHRSLSHGNTRQAPVARHSMAWWDCQPDPESKFTIDDLLRRHCGWPFTIADGVQCGDLVRAAYHAQLARSSR